MKKALAHLIMKQWNRWKNTVDSMKTIFLSSKIFHHILKRKPDGDFDQLEVYYLKENF